MKKAVSLLLCLGILAGTLTACQKPSTDTDTDTRADGTTDGTVAETEPPFVLETEEEEPPEEIKYPYDNTHAYVFASSDKKTNYVASGLHTAPWLNTIHAVPANGTPIVTFTFTPDECFSADEYPYVAYRYKATSRVTRGAFLVSSTDYPVLDYSNGGATWFDLNNRGEWTNLIINMKENNGFWSKTITQLRIDILQSEDPNAELYLDRVGFFKTEADAQAFLDAAEQVDYSVSYQISEGYSSVFVPAGAASDESVPADFILSDTALALKKDGITPIVGIRNGDTVTPVPVSYVNGAGYISYMAQIKGEYVLCYPEKNPVTDADFVYVRGIMNESMLSAEEVTLETVWSALRNTLTDFVDQPVADWAASLGFDTSNPQKVATATDISKIIHAYLTLLDADVYVDPDYYPAPNAIKAIKVAVGSGIITDITASSLSGEELASVMTRLVKAMLGQPVLPSNIKENTIKIGAWSYMIWGATEEDIRKAADCGLNFLVSRGPIDIDPVRRDVLYGGMKYGVRALFNEYVPWDYDVNAPTPLPPLSCQYYDFDSFMGNHVFDEPGTQYYDRMAHLANNYSKALPGKLCFYNLLPMYASYPMLYGPDVPDLGSVTPEIYRDYVESYAQTVPGDYISVDIYPLSMDDKDRKFVTYKDYFQNMDVFATVCREYDRDFWLYIQSYNHGTSGNWRADYQDFSLQMYAGLCFGANTFMYFTYGCYHPLGDDALMSYFGQPTEQYDDAQKINREIMALSNDYMQYKNLGAFNLNCGKDVYKYARFDNQYTDFDILKEVNSNNALLFGCFEKEEGEGYAFSVVNLVDGLDRDRSKPATLTFTLEGEHIVHAWIKGEKVALTPENGVYTLNLNVAEGAFVTID